MSNFLKAVAVVSAIYGIAGVLFPNFLLTNYGVSTEPAVILMTRFFGVTLIGWGIANWLISDCTEWIALRGLLVAAVIADAVGVAVSVAGTAAGTMNMMGWSAVVIYAVFGLGSLYFLISGRQTVPSRA
jgi:hypothetical protein